MPKKKTGQRKKAEKQKERLQAIRAAHLERPLVDRPCNITIVCYCFPSVHLIFFHVCHHLSKLSSQSIIDH